MLRTTIGLLFAVALSALANSVHNSTDIVVTWLGGHDCTLEFLGQKLRCALGKNGVTRRKREGDGMTPIGSFPLRRAFYRQDKTNTPCFSVAPHLNCEATQTDFGWIDAPSDAMYNQFVRLPYKGGSVSHENLFLDDSAVYDLLAVIGYNDDPVVPYAGSAIFFHVASEGYGATAGCVSLALVDLAFVLSQATPATRFVVTDGS
jgi:L,D-peptidoglycan transpeptidase YkuD (ErfK/YbiS/YcfS/YnhG family)|eukprot:gene5158-3679_t